MENVVLPEINASIEYIPQNPTRGLIFEQLFPHLEAICRFNKVIYPFLSFQVSIIFSNTITGFLLFLASSKKFEPAVDQYDHLIKSTESLNLKPEHWITDWSFKMSFGGFMYATNGGVVNMMCNDLSHIRLEPDNRLEIQIIYI